MKFNIGDPVMHWTYGMSRVIGIEEHSVMGKSGTYYKIGINETILWVPDDQNLENRLRAPTSAAGFQQLFSILETPGGSLPDNRQERKMQILERLKDGRADTLCRVIRDLVAYQQTRPLNQADQNIMKRVHDSLIGEWIFTFSVSLMEAEKELGRILASGIPGVQVKL